MHKTELKGLSRNVIPKHELKQGDLGEVMNGPYEGEIVFCAYGRVVVSLNNGEIWTKPTSDSKVRLLTEGEKVILTAGKHCE